MRVPVQSSRAEQRLLDPCLGHTRIRDTAAKMNEGRGIVIVVYMGLEYSTRKRKANHVPGPISRSKHDMATNSPWNIQVDLDIVCRRLVQCIPVLVSQPPHLPLSCPRIPPHERFPNCTSPPIRYTFESAFSQFIFFRWFDTPDLNIATMIPSTRFKHSVPFRYSRSFLGRYECGW